MRMFILKNCPHCKRAIGWIEELKRENSEYEKIEIELVDEEIDSDLANQYNYYYVPAIYDGEFKLHEGVATKNGIKTIFDSYLKNNM